MMIYPAIDISNRECVRLEKGDFKTSKTYSNDPLELALRWEKEGAKNLHIVDLDGAKEGTSRNLEIIYEIANKVKIPIQLGGGIRSIERIEEVLSNGVDRVILGTKAVKDESFLSEALRKYQDKIVVGIDGKNGRAATNGWLSVSEINEVDLAKKMEALGVRTIIYTDISKDGMLLGPNLNGIMKMKENVSIEIIASGGVGSINDIKALRLIGVTGTVVGKALYESKFSLKEALIAGGV